MKQSLLLAGALLLAGSLISNAENKFYPQGFDQFNGSVTVTGMSFNGRYATAADADNGISYLWDSEHPEDLTVIPKGNTRFKGVVANGVSNEGIIVGTINLGATTRPAIYQDQKWTMLPVSEAVRNTAEALQINADATVILGYQFINDPESEIAGRYYPCIWRLQSDETWEMEVYISELPAHQGFIPSAMSQDGNMIVGTLNVPAGSTIPCYYENGKPYWFDVCDTQLLPYYYKDKLLGYYEYYFINGYDDGKTGEYFEGGYTWIDQFGILYGGRTRAEDVDTDPKSDTYGEGTLLKGAYVFNSETEEFIDYMDDRQFNCGLEAKFMFGTKNNVVTEDGVSHKLNEYFNYDEQGLSVKGVSHTSCDGKILAGVHSTLNPATMEEDYAPFFLVLDNPLIQYDAVEEVAGTEASVEVAGGTITVTGAEKVSVYNLAGQLVSKSAVSNVAPGIYVVKADNSAVKVLVK